MHKTCRFTFGSAQGASCLVATILLASLTNVGYATVGDTQIATWKDNFSGALSLTIDDALSDREDTLAILDDFGVKATFFLNTDDLMARPSLQTAMIGASQNGHEIGSHTLTHPNLTSLNDADLDSELRDSQTILEDLVNKPVITLAYPFGADDQRVRTAASQYYLAGRDVYPDAIHPATGQDMFMLGEAPGPGFWTDAQFIAERLSFATEAVTTGGWAIEMYHNLANFTDELHHTEAALRGHLTNLTSGNLSLWVAPAGDVVQYYLSREGTSISTTLPSSEELTVGLTLNDPTGRIAAPLTLTTEVPATWDLSQIEVSQNGSLLPFTTSSNGSDLQITYNALPNGGDVILSTSFSGDFDGDTDVDGADFLLWQRGYLAPYDSDDLADWETNYGTLAGQVSASSAVPEPSGLLLFLSGLLSLLKMRSRKVRPAYCTVRIRK